MQTFGKSRAKKFLAISMLFLTLLSCLPNTIKYVNADEAETVRIGYYLVDGFISYDEIGTQQGYYVDYLERVAQITGWNYEFVELNSVKEGQEKLLEHEIDFLAPSKMTLENMEIFDYSQYSFGTEYLVLVARGNNDDIYYEDYDGMDGANIGVLDNFDGMDAFNAYMVANGFSANLVYYTSNEQINDALDKGDIDLILTYLMMSDDTQKIVARFDPYPFYFMTWKGNDAKLSSLNEAMQNLKNTYPGLETELLTAYFPSYNVVYFTRQEQEFIDSLQPIKVAYVTGNIPISFTDKNGEFRGISREIFDKIQEISGLRFEYEALPEGDITYDFLREQGFDLITGVRYNRSNLYSRGILLTNPYLSSKMVLVGNSESDFDIDSNYTVVVMSGSQTLNSEIVSNYPNFNVVTANSIEECFESVNNGDADLLMTDRYVADYWLTKPMYSKLYTIPVDELTDELSFSVVVDIYGNETLSGLNGVELVSIINKTLSQITDDEIDEIIINENNANRYEYTFKDYIYVYRWSFLISILAIVMVVICIFHNRKIKKDYRRQLEEENKRYNMMMDSYRDLAYNEDKKIAEQPEKIQESDTMTGLLAKHAFEEKAREQFSLKRALNSAIIFVDLDYFQNLNSTLGHEVGDAAIKDTAEKIKEHFSGNDCVSRYGGDKFCIIIWDIPEVKLREKLGEIVNSLNNEYKIDDSAIRLTASVGAVYCTLRDTEFDTMLSVAEIALYEAKDRGRNQYVLKEL